MTNPDASGDEIALVATLTARPGKEAALIAALSGILDDVRREPGCLAYDLHVDREDGTSLVMLERWADADALAAHAAGAPLRSLGATLGDLLAAPPRLVRLKRLA